MQNRSPKFQTQHKICSKLKVAFLTLLEALEYAEDTSSDLWDFAVSIQEFQELGLSDQDLRWLVRKGYVEHAREVTKPGDEGRRFQPFGELIFCQETCFVLTQDGIAAAHSLSSAEHANSINGVSPPGNGAVASAPDQVPRWDPVLRELYWECKIVKRYKWQAVNQEVVLTAFEEEGWPLVIDDPLPPKPNLDSKRRLHDTIKALNRNQENPIVRFHGDGTGEGIRWELTDKDHSED